MQHRRMGRSGLSVSRLALGTMGWGAGTPVEDARDHLKAYLAAGGDFVDTAHSYADGASEEALGTMLGDLVPRGEVVICTKAGISLQTGTRVVDTSRRALMHQLDTSLRRLGTPYVDLWLVHTWSDDTPADETLSALEWAVTSGRARYVGVSNYSGWQAAHAATLLSANRIPLVADEIEYSLLNRIPEDELVSAGQALGFGLLPWSPLGRGVLTGKYRHGIPDESRAGSGGLTGPAGLNLTEESAQIVDAVAIAARGMDVSPAEIALAWVRDRPGVVAPIVGVRTTAQLNAALASEDLELPHELTQALNDVSD
ncbi:MAG: aldo/keto reductase [Actinobacteria bacterium]|nr:aldo/keto reductase [Actinomycetota bacterium]